MKKEYTGTDGTIGFISAWESNIEDVEKGELETGLVNLKNVLEK